MSRSLLKPPGDTPLSPISSDAAESLAGLRQEPFRWSPAT